MEMIIGTPTQEKRGELFNRGERFVLAFFVLGDLITTMYFTSLGMTEANPIFRYIIENINEWPLILIMLKLIAVEYIFYLANKYKTNIPYYIAGGLGFYITIINSIAILIEIGVIKIG